MLIDRDVKGAEEYMMPFKLCFVLTKHCRYTKHTISELLQNRVDMSQLVITKALSKNGTSF